MSNVKEQATAEFFIIDSASSWMGECDGSWQNFHEKMLLVCEARINERIILIFNENFNKT